MSPTNIYMEATRDNAQMIIEHSAGGTTIIDFDDAVINGIPAIAAYMDEEIMDVCQHFVNGDHLQIDDDALFNIPH